MDQNTEEQSKCPYCGKAVETPVSKKIIDRGWNSQTRKQYVRERSMVFCSSDCGSFYQMGCEG